MSVSEHDLEIIESWLDGEISEAQATALRDRISADPQLAQTVDRLRSERSLRTGIWQTMEPSDKQAEMLVSNIRRAVRKEDLIDGRLRTLRKFASAAAVVALVFGAGWISHSRIQYGEPKPEALANVTVNPLPSIPRNTQMPNGSQQGGNLVRFEPYNTQQRPANNGSFVIFRDGQDPQRDARTGMPVDHNRVSTILPRYHATITSPMGAVYDYQLDKLSDLAELQQRVEQDELNARQKPLTPQVGPRNRGNETMPVSSEQPLIPSGR